MVQEESTVEKKLCSESIAGKAIVVFELQANSDCEAYVQNFDKEFENGYKPLVGTKLHLQGIDDGSDKNWHTSGVVTRISDVKILQVSLKINRIFGNNPPREVEIPCGVKVPWNPITFNRRTAALDKLAKRACSLLPENFSNFILGHRLLDQAIDMSLPSNYSAPGLAVLNRSQKKAVRYALQHQYTMIVGPPGTGKTATAATLVYHLVQQQERRHEINSTCRATSGKILVVTQSNVACNELAKRLQKTEVNVVRLCGRSSEDPENRTALSGLKTVHTLAMNVVNPNNASDARWLKLLKRNEEEALSGKDKTCYLRGKFEREVKVMQEASVICCTCTTAGDRRLDGIPIHAVLIDEASQAIEPDCLIPIARGCQQVILIGDHKQLGPVVQSQVAADAGLSRTMFDRFILLGRPLQWLTVQYRMHPELIKFPNRQFYDGILKNGVTSEERTPVMGFPWPNYTKPMVLYSVKGVEEREKNDTSFLNQKEGSRIVSAIVQLIEAGVKASDIGIITPYAAQRRFLANLFSSSKVLKNIQAEIEINTVDGFQGREKEYILFSSVRSGDTMGFVASPRRLNVAITRARRGLILVGDADTLVKDPLWKDIVDHLKSEGLVQYEARRRRRRRRP